MNCFLFRRSCKARHFVNIIKSLTLVTVVMSAGIYSQISLASCVINSGSTEFNLPPVQFPPLDPRTPINDVLATINTYAANTAGQSNIICTEREPTPLRTEFTHISGLLYDTGLSGIAMRIKIGDYTKEAYIPNSLKFAGLFNAFAVPVQIELIRTDDFIETGVIPAKVLATSYSPVNDDFVLFNVNMLAPITISLMQPTCSATTPNMTVNLGTVSIADFNIQGRTTPKDFTIDLDCAGVAGTTNVHVTLTDANNPGNTTTQLGLSPDSDALGIALEVNNKFGAVTFGPDLEGIGNPGQWLEGTAGVGSFSIPLSVNYVRLPGPIKGGTANSGITYTLNYD